MSNFLTSSIGQKFLMSISGLFLISFLFVHLTVNSFLVLDSSGQLFNEGAHFMAVNPIIRVVEPVLFAGFILHIVYSLILTLQNMKARGSEKYYVVNQANSSSWASRNMFILGAVVLGVLVMHLIHFWWKIKFAGDASLQVPVIIDGVQQTEMENTYALVSGLFKTYLWVDILYAVWAVFLGLHLSHAFWSAFQTIGFSNILWRKRLSILGNVLAIIIAGGFAIIPIVVYLMGN